MTKILNGMFYLLKFLLIVLAFGSSLYVLVAMYRRLDKNMIDLLRVFIPYIVLVVLWILNIFFRQQSVTKNVFYNLTCCLVFATIILLACRALFDESMILILKTKYHTNFDFFSDMLTFANVMIYGLCIADVFLALSDAKFKFGKKDKKVDNHRNDRPRKKEKPIAVQIEDEETL